MERQGPMAKERALEVLKADVSCDSGHPSVLISRIGFCVRETPPSIDSRCVDNHLI